MSDPLALGCCANCRHWHKIRKMPHGSCELYKAKGIQDEIPTFETGERIVNPHVAQVFLIITTDRAVCSEWEHKK